MEPSELWPFVSSCWALSVSAFDWWEICIVATSFLHTLGIQKKNSVCTNLTNSDIWYQYFILPKWWWCLLYLGWEAKGFNYQSFVYTVRSFCLSDEVSKTWVYIKTSEKLTMNVQVSEHWYPFGQAPTCLEINKHL